MKKRFTLFTLTLFLAVSPRAAERCDCDAEVVDAVAGYDLLLNLTASQKATAEDKHLRWGIPLVPPAATHEHLLHQKDFLIWYDDDLRVPLWVAHRLRKADLDTNRDRVECFRRDLRLTDDTAGFCEDYLEPIFDRGHMLPSADMVRSEAAMINTYTFANMTPQFANFNRGIWEKLESYARKWAKLKGKVYVISGAVFDRDSNGSRDADTAASRVAPQNRVAIPTHFYKIIIHTRWPQPAESITFLLPHDNEVHKKAESITYLKGNLVSIRTIEGLAGTTFFPKLATAKRDALVDFKAADLWPLK